LAKLARVNSLSATPKTVNKIKVGLPLDTFKKEEVYLCGVTVIQPIVRLRLSSPYLACVLLRRELDLNKGLKPLKLFIRFFQPSTGMPKQFPVYRLFVNLNTVNQVLLFTYWP